MEAESRAPHVDSIDKGKAKAVLTRFLAGSKRRKPARPSPAPSRRVPALRKVASGLPDDPLEIGVALFNTSPEEGVEYLLHRCGGLFDSLDAVAQLLSHRHGINRLAFGNYLGAEGSTLLASVLQGLDFQFRDIDMALRQLFYVILLPEKPAAVDRILLGFADKFFKQNSADTFASVEAVYAVALAIVRLNADLRSGDRVGQFVRQLKGMNNGEDFAEERLLDLRDAVCEDEIRPRENDPFPEALHRRWLMMKSSRGKARKWVVLEPTRILVSRTNTVSETKHMIPYETIASVCLHGKDGAAFLVTTAEREFVFFCNSQMDAHHWVDKLQEIILEYSRKREESEVQKLAESEERVKDLKAMLASSSPLSPRKLRKLLNSLTDSPLLNQGCLHAAIKRNDPLLVASLLVAGASPDSCDRGVPAIGDAARATETEILLILMEAGADLTVVWSEKGRQWTPLLAACHAERKESVKMLLDSGKLEDCDVNFMVESAWRSTKRGPMLARGKTVLDLEKAGRAAMTSMHQHNSVMQLAEMQRQFLSREDSVDSQLELVSAGQALVELESKWSTILQVTTNEEIRDLLVEHGAKPASGLIESWLVDHTKRSMDALCRRLTSIPRSGYPVILIPGYCSSVLECWESTKKPDWVGSRLWVAIGQMTTSAIKNGSATNDWLHHMMLNQDLTDPEGIRVRPAQGLHAVDYLVGGVGREASYVYGPIIRAFMAAGYTPNNLTAFAYDWRTTPSQLESRDGAFTLLRSQIEGFVRVNGKRVVLIAHSMGNMFLHYFLFWAQKHLSQAWIDQHIRIFVAMGAPWAGASKLPRCLNTGDAVGLEMLLTYAETVAFCRRNASSGWLYPTTCDSKLESCMYVSNDKKAPQPVPHTNMLDYLSSFRSMMEREYVNDELHGGIQDGHSVPTRFRPPPVEELLCIYGKNLPTEIGAVFKALRKPQPNRYGDDFHIKLDMNKRRGRAIVQDKPGVVFKNGLLQEVPWEDAEGTTHSSGDGTVEWRSLTYYKKWVGQKGAPRIREFVIDEAEHRDMLGMPDVIWGLISRIAMLS